jgi:hypothetical protein
MAFDYATLLSGSDYPIKSNREIAAFLEQHRGEEFLESLLLTEPNRWSAYGGLYKTPEKVLCRHLRFRSRVWRLPGFRTMPDGMKPYGGSQWWTLSRAAMMHIAEVAKDRPEVLSFSGTHSSRTSRLFNRLCRTRISLTEWSRMICD